MATGEKLRVLVLYGGDAATHARHELQVWLAKPSLNVEPRIVADDPPHSEGAVDDRVDAAMEWADKAIAIITPDERCEHGAPNVMDEIGRWRGMKGKRSLCILRQEGVTPYSNHAGIVYAGFKSRVNEKFDALREFLLDEVPASEKAAVKASGKGELIVESNPNTLLLNGRRFRSSKIEELQGSLTIVVTEIEGHGEATLRALGQRAAVEIAYGNTATAGQLEECRFTHENGLVATLTIKGAERRHSSMMEAAWGGNGGAGQLSADEIATMRASRILFNDPPAATGRDQFGPEMLIRGGMHGGTPITGSPIAPLLKQLPRGDRASWEGIRLVLLQQLRMSGTVEHVELLRLTVVDGRLVRIEFRGRRASPYANAEGHVIEFDRAVDY